MNDDGWRRAGFFFLVVVLTLTVGSYVAVVVFVAFLRVYLVEFASAMGVRGTPDPAMTPRPAPARTDAPGDGSAGSSGTEPAYPQYLFGPARRDLVEVRRLTVPGLKDMWRRRKTDADLLWDTPFIRRKASGVARLAGLGVGAFFGLLVLLVVVGVQLLVLGGMYLVALLFILAFRAVDTLRLRIKRIWITCPACHRRGRQLLYKCPKCGERHTDIRPGRYGVFRRVCRCGAKVRTRRIWVSHEMIVFCSDPECDVPLADGAGSRPEIVLAVLGDPQCGKTRLMLCMFMSIREFARQTGREFRLADKYTRDWEREARRDFLRYGRIGKTLVQKPRAWEANVATRRFLWSPRPLRKRLVHVFDPAGEVFQGPKKMELEYHHAARTFVYVLDPLSIQEVWEIIPHSLQKQLRSERALRDPARRNATDEGNLMHDLLHDFDEKEVPLHESRLLVAVTKWDLVKEHVESAADPGNPPPTEGDGDSIERWLNRLHQGNLTRTMRHRFREVRFFLVASSADSAEQVHGTVEYFTREMLDGFGLRYLPDTAGEPRPGTAR